MPAHALPPSLAPLVLGALCLLPLVPLLVWRSWALSPAPDEPRAARWFGFALRAHALLLANLLVLTPLVSGLGLGAALVGDGGGWRGVLRALAGALPLTVQVAASALIAGELERTLRGVQRGPRQRFVELAGRMGVIVPFAAGVAILLLAAMRHDLRTGLVGLVAGLLVTLVIATTRSAQAGCTPESATTGPLRDRVFELAKAAGVEVRQVYVLAAGDARLANAFAVQGGNVLLTDHLLARLPRREVEGVIAHELAHLRAHHPTLLAWALVGSGVASALLWQLPLGPWRLPVALVACMSVYLALARRFEFAADREAVRNTGDAEGLVRGLVRIGTLNDTPSDWHRAWERMLTHPSTRRRAEALARAGHIAPGQLDALLMPPAADADGFRDAVPSRAPVSGTPARSRESARLSWLLLAAVTLAPAALFAGLALAGLHPPRLVAVGIATLVAFTAALLVTDRSAAGSYRAWERELEERLAPGTGALFVGLAPGPDDVLYENFADWDLGFLTLDADALRYHGERARFVLARGQIVSCERSAGLPGWLPTPRVAIVWRDAAGAERRLSLRDARVRHLHELPGSSAQLCERIAAWRSQPAPEGVTALTADTPPDGAAVTATRIADLVAPRTLGQLVAPLALTAFVAAGVTGVPIAPWNGIGLLEIAAGAWLALVALRIPIWRASARAPRPVRTAPAERAA